MRGDRGDVILGWFTKIALVLGLLALVGFDAVAVGVAHVNVQDTAGDAASEAASMWNNTHDVRQAYRAAQAYAEKHNATVPPKSFTIDRDGTVHLRLEKDATTLLLYRTKTTKRWTHVTGTGTRRNVA